MKVFPVMVLLAHIYIYFRKHIRTNYKTIASGKKRNRVVESAEGVCPEWVKKSLLQERILLRRFGLVTIMT